MKFCEDEFNCFRLRFRSLVRCVQFLQFREIARCDVCKNSFNNANTFKTQILLKLG